MNEQASESQLPKNVEIGIVLDMPLHEPAEPVVLPESGRVVYLKVLYIFITTDEFY